MEFIIVIRFLSYFFLILAPELILGAKERTGGCNRLFSIIISSDLRESSDLKKFSLFVSFSAFEKREKENLSPRPAAQQTVRVNTTDPYIVAIKAKIFKKNPSFFF